MKRTKTLFVSDLDETLLRSDETLSPFTVNTVNGLIERGMKFSFATARSLKTASDVTRGLAGNLPAIVYNGTFIRERGTGELLLSNEFPKAESDEILSVLLDCGLSPFVRSIVDGEEKIAYLGDRITPLMQKYLDRRPGDPRMSPKFCPQELFVGGVFTLCCMDADEPLRRAYELLRGRHQCLHFIDPYTGGPWLEILTRGASKANAALALKEMLGCERLVCFGNGLNDISMFRVADECYAVGNAVQELKDVATAVIGRNDEDGVARALLSLWERME